MQPSIEVRDLTKRYDGVAAVDRLSFTVRPGVVTGFVGPNGAGKSTTLRLVLGLAAADSGTALVNGARYASPPEPLRVVGALLDAGATHPGRRAGDHLLWMARSNGIPSRRVGEVLDLVGLASVARQRTGTFSLGMSQRLGIAAALLGDPPVLVLDEPVNGLDPDGIRWIRWFLRSLAADGRIVFVSSHLMGELEGTADHLVVIGRGRLLADAPVQALITAVSGSFVAVRTPDRSEVMTALANAGATVASLGQDRLTVNGLSAEQVADIGRRLGLRLTELTPHRASLEDAYLQLTGDAVDFTPTDRSPRR